MKRARHFLLAAIATFALVGGSPSQAADWPQYRGLTGNGISTEALPSTLQIQPIWQVPAASGFSSFAVADGRAFTLVTDEASKREVCLALDAKTGKELWQRELGSSKYSQGGGDAGAPGNRGGDGPRSTPSTDGQRVYVYDSYLLLSCFDAATGKTIWQQDISADYEGRNIKWLNATSPLLDGDRLYVAGGGAGQSFLAFDAPTGKLLWKRGDETLTHATPHLTSIRDQQQIIFFMKSGLVSVAPDTGQEIWRRKFKFSTSTAASPVSFGDQVYCSAGYGVGAGFFSVTDQPTAEKVWLKPNKLMNHWSTPLALDGHLYGIFEFKKYGKAPLQCVELATGEIKWRERGFGPGNCILVDDKLIVLSDAGELVIAKASPEGYQEISRTKVLDGKCWSTPAYSDGRVYVRSTQQGACLQLSP